MCLRGGSVLRATCVVLLLLRGEQVGKLRWGGWFARARPWPEALVLGALAPDALHQTATTSPLRKSTRPSRSFDQLKLNLSHSAHPPT